MGAVLTAGELRKGLKLEIDGEPYLIVDFEFSKPGKGQALYRCRLKNMITGAQFDRTYRSGEKFSAADLEEQQMQYLYSDGESYHFMNTSSYDQIEMLAGTVGEASSFLSENLVVNVLLFQGRPIGLTLPNFVELKIVQSAPGIKGDTASGATKPATLETGHVILVPLFVEEGETVRIDTRTGQYVERVKGLMEIDEREALRGKRRFLETRCRVLRLIRAFFESEGFLEVQTPLLTAAPAPEVHISPIPAGSGRFLSTSPELHMKRLLAAGFDKIFQVTRAFRAGERGRLHHPEFTILEWYRSGANYKDLQQDCQKLLRLTCRAITPGSGLHFRGVCLDFEGPWERWSVRDAFKKFAGWDPGPDPDQDRFDLDMAQKVETNLGFPAPCILEDYPKSRAALARIKPADPEVAERFELFWAGIEIANGFSELTDPVEQRARFQSAIARKLQIEGIGYPLPGAFLASLEHLGPCAGIAFGVDRFVMLLSDAESIDDVVAFAPETA